MKKLSLLLLLLLSSSFTLGVITNAADDDLDLGDLGSDLGLDDNDLDSDDTNQDDDTDQKVQLDRTSVTDNSITLLLHPVDGYTKYKVYYTTDGNDVAEKEVEYDGQGVTSVTLSDLKPNTTYIITAKAFDDDGNPVESTVSDELTIATKAAEQTHQAATDNVLYNPKLTLEKDGILVTYKPGSDVEKVQISISDDGGKTFKPVAVVPASTTSYKIKTTKPGEKYVKLVPVSKDGELGVCKIGKTNVQFLKAEVKKPVEQKPAEKKIGKPKTGPETYLLIVLAILAYVVYARRKMKA